MSFHCITINRNLKTKTDNVKSIFCWTGVLKGHYNFTLQSKPKIWLSDFSHQFFSILDRVSIYLNKLSYKFMLCQIKLKRFGTTLTETICLFYIGRKVRLGNAFFENFMGLNNFWIKRALRSSSDF